MKCNKCSNEGVEVTVLNKTSWYCRNCKVDVYDTTDSSLMESLYKYLNKYEPTIQEQMNEVNDQWKDSFDELIGGTVWEKYFKPNRGMDRLEFDKRDLHYALVYSTFLRSVFAVSEITLGLDSIWKYLQEN